MTEEELEFNLKPVDDIPSRSYRKGSKYDVIIDALKESDEELLEVKVKGKEANYLRTQLKKRIEALGLEDTFEATVTNDICFIKRKKPKKKKPKKEPEKKKSE